MTHPTDHECRLHGALEQHRRERDWDRSWGLVEALRETRLLGPVVGTIVLAALGVYAAAWATGQGDILGGLVIGAISIIAGGLLVDTELCKGTPATVHECRRCRRATDRWRGSTRDGLWATSLVGQQSAAARTPQALGHGVTPAEIITPREWSGTAEPAVREIVEPRTADGAALLEEVKAHDAQAERLDDLPAELEADLQERFDALADVCSPEEFAEMLSADSTGEEIQVEQLNGGTQD